MRKTSRLSFIQVSCVFPFERSRLVAFRRKWMSVVAVYINERTSLMTRNDTYCILPELRWQTPTTVLPYIRQINLGDSLHRKNRIAEEQTFLCFANAGGRNRKMPFLSNLIHFRPLPNYRETTSLPKTCFFGICFDRVRSLQRNIGDSYALFLSCSHAYFVRCSGGSSWRSLVIYT